MKQINIPPIRIPEFRMPSLGLSAIGLPADRSGNRLAWPSGLKDSIVCWYSPRKQGLTEYDVIESYAEDFTSSKFDVKDANATVTNKVLTYSRDAVEPTTSRILTTKEELDEMVVKVTLDVSAFSYRYLDKNLNLIDIKLKNGINVLPKSYSNNFYIVGFIYTGNKYAANITIEQLPTSKAKDFSANGHDLFLYKFKGKLDSGIGLYLYDFTSDLRINSAHLPYTDIQANSICSLSGHVAGWLFQFKDPNINIAPLKIKVKGIVNNIFEYWGYDENGIRFYFKINKDGVYELPASYVVETNNGVGIICLTDCVDNVCFTQIPDYPNQLCYNGSSYGVAYGLPILNDYTIIADRVPFDYDGAFCSKRTKEDKGAFFLEKRAADKVEYAFSFGSTTKINFVQPGITWQTANSYNGQTITKGTLKDTDFFLIGGGLYKTDSDLYTELWKGCHGDILLFNRTLTDDEITWLKENWEKL